LNKPNIHNGHGVVSDLTVSIAQRLAKTLVEGRYQEKEVFKDNAQSYVARVEAAGMDCMVKIPRARNRRIWQRFLSLFRESEALQYYNSMQTLRGMNFGCPAPLIAVEKRRAWRVATHSLFAYQYVEGRKCTESDAAVILPELLRLHEKGYLRGDPHKKNYLISNNAVVFIDARIRQPKLFRKLQMHRELAVFLNTSPGGIHHVPAEIKHSASFRTAWTIDRIMRYIRHSRRRIIGQCQSPPNK